MGGVSPFLLRRFLMVDRLDHWTERALAFIDSPEGRMFYKRNKYEYGLNRTQNLFRLIQKATYLIKYEHLIAVYARVRKALYARKRERIAG
jgi:hypothetical protein